MGSGHGACFKGRGGAGRIMEWAQDFLDGFFEEAKKGYELCFIVGSKKALEGYRPLCMNRFFLKWIGWDKK